MSSGYFELLLSFLSRNTKNTSAAQAIKNVTPMVRANITVTLPGARLATFNARPPTAFQCEELRVICGTRGNPDTVAPFRAWRGSRDLVAQSPKFHAPAAAHFRAAAGLSLAHRSLSRATPGLSMRRDTTRFFQTLLRSVPSGFFV